MKKQITLAVTGSISAYKAADLISLLKKEGFAVTVLMTQAASAFITPLTLQVLSQNKVHLDVMQEKYPRAINHIEIAKKTDLFLVAPLSANTLSKLANGFADNMVTTTSLALPSHIPKLLAPAMNTQMYLNPLVTKNLATLKEVGYQVISPRSTRLACGDVGIGALAELSDIISAVKEIFHEKTS